MRLVLKINRISYLKISVQGVQAYVCLCVHLYACVHVHVHSCVYVSVFVSWLANMSMPQCVHCGFQRTTLGCQSSELSCSQMHILVSFLGFSCLYHPSQCRRPGIIIDAFAVVSNFYVGSQESKPKSLCLQSKHFMQ